MGDDEEAQHRPPQRRKRERRRAVGRDQVGEDGDADEGEHRPVERRAQRAGQGESRPAAATPSAICMPAMEMGTKKAWPASPA